MAGAARTALSFAASHCDNYRKNGQCWGIYTGPNPAQFGAGHLFANPLPRCFPAQSVPCRYFERCILPQAERHLRFASVGIDYRARTFGWEARKAASLHAGHPFLGHMGRSSEQKEDRYCKCGARLNKKRRVCDGCQREKRRETTRMRVRKHRGATYDGV